MRGWLESEFAVERKLFESGVYLCPLMVVFRSALQAWNNEICFTYSPVARYWSMASNRTESLSEVFFASYHSLRADSNYRAPLQWHQIRCFLAVEAVSCKCVGSQYLRVRVCPRS